MHRASRPRERDHQTWRLLRTDGTSFTHVGVERPPRVRISAALGKLLDPPDADASIERDGHHVADLQGVAGRGDATAIDPHTTARHETRRRGPRLHEPRMPQPLVDALPIHALRALMSDPHHVLSLLFGAALQLFFQRGELGERRIRIDRPFARRARRKIALTALVPPLVAMTIMPITATAVVTITMLIRRVG